MCECGCAERLEQRVEDLEEQNQALEQRVEDLEEQNQALEEQVEEQQQQIEVQVEEQQQQIEVLEVRANAYSSRFENILEEAFGHVDAFDSSYEAYDESESLHDRLEDLEEGQGQPQQAARAGDGDGEGEETTPLERIVSLPEHLAQQELSANQERARFVAQDITDYAEKVPAGLRIDSRAIKKVITASEGKKPHTQTVARVMDFLEQLGKDGVTLKDRRGRKFLVIQPEMAEKLEVAHHTRCDQGGAETPPESVIS